MGTNPHANGGELLHAAAMPDFRDYAIEVANARYVKAEATRVLG